MLENYFDFPERHFKLWFEYLKQSEKYKDYCDWIKDGSPPLSPPPNHTALDYTFSKCGDIHNTILNQFEVWYEFMKYQIENPPETSIEYAQEFIIQIMQESSDRLRKRLNREPSLVEFERYFSTERGVFYDVDPNTFIVKPNLGDNNKKIAKAVNNWCKKKAMRKPTMTEVHYDNIENYLKAFKLEKEDNKDRRQISESMGLVIDEKGYGCHSCSLYIKKAEKIIKNTETGVFPGEYGEEEI